ncbi:MAG: JAB domain-containing protein [Marinoscillum sp.]
MQIEEVKLTYKNKIRAKDRPKITCAKDAYDLFIKSWDDTQIELVEEAKAMFLDRQLRLMSISSISKGGFSETVVDLRLVFAIALKRRASGIIIAHNHPSGSLRPSRADIALTNQFQKAGEILRIPLEDHLIITKEAYHSIMSEL